MDGNKFYKMKLFCYCNKEIENIEFKNYDYNVYEVKYDCICGQKYFSMDRGFVEDKQEAKRILHIDFKLDIKND